MPYCGRCLNVGKAGKRGAPPEYGPVSTSTAVCYFVRLNRLRTGPACDLREAGAPGHPIEGVVGRGSGEKFRGLLSRLAETHPAINWLQTFSPR